MVLTEKLQETEDGQRDQHFGRQVRVGGRLLVAFQAALFGQHVFQCGTDDAERHSRFIEACAAVKKRKQTTRRVSSGCGWTDGSDTSLSRISRVCGGGWRIVNQRIAAADVFDCRRRVAVSFQGTEVDKRRVGGTPMG